MCLHDAVKKLNAFIVLLISDLQNDKDLDSLFITLNDLLSLLDRLPVLHTTSKSIQK